jgi:4-amino-4-deoxy-L-arabinose transferase-like glycosyltransferase
MVRKTNISGDTFLFLILLVISFVVYLFNLTFSDIWIDESFSLALIKHPFSKMFTLITDDFHPPLYYLGLKAFTGLTGITVFNIRLFSVLGAVSTLIVSFTAGRRAIGEKGALYFCILLLSIPMLASHSHDARMYTWAAFSITGVFLYGYLFLQTGSKYDLVFLTIFTFLAVYIHYYSLIGAFWANIFIVITGIIQKKKIWRKHLISLSIVSLLFLPWFFILLHQTAAASKDFWIAPVSGQTILSCYIDPFARKFWIEPFSIILIIITYSLTLLTIFNTYKNEHKNDGLILGLALTVFNLTVISGILLSLFIKPVLISRYIMPVVPLLMIPPVVFIKSLQNKVLKPIILGVVFCTGIIISIQSSYFSYGPYKQSLDYINEKFPSIQKLLHVSEITAGPFSTYTNTNNITNYCIKNDSVSYYTNMSVFQNLQMVPSIDKMVKKDEVFCLVDYNNNTLNKSYFNNIINKNILLQTDTIIDYKSKESMKIIVYIIQYK